MEDTNNTQNVEEVKENDVNTTETTETQTEQEKTFTQADLDKLISERLKREKSKMPAKEELDAFKEWKKTQQTEQERIAEQMKEFEATKSELQRLKNEKEVLKNGVDSKFTDYVIYEVSKMEGDFAENLKEFLSINSHFSTNTVNATTPTHIPAGGQKIKNEAGKTDLSQLSDEEYFRKVLKK